MNKELINDDRLTPDMKRIRNGRFQIFSVEGMQDITIEHGHREMYAELIDDKWYWISGCAECNGEPRDGFAYIGECDKHNVCRECGISNKELTEPAWGGREGWCCVPCMNELNRRHRIDCLAKVAEKEYDTWDYMHTDNIICPHCGDSIEVDGDPDEYSGENECDTCGGKYEVEVNYSVDYTTSVIGERIT